MLLEVCVLERVKHYKYVDVTFPVLLSVISCAVDSFYSEPIDMLMLPIMYLIGQNKHVCTVWVYQSADADWRVRFKLCCCFHHFSAQCVQWSLHISPSPSLSYVSLSGSPLWSPGAAIIVPPTPLALYISLILFSSHTPPLCLKTPFLDANWQRRARTSFSYVILRKKKRHDNANSQRQRFSRSTNARHALKWSRLRSTLRLCGGRDGRTHWRETWANLTLDQC